MVRERVGDWRLAWRFALAGLLAGLLVVVLSTRGVMSGPFFAAQDQLFPAGMLLDENTVDTIDNLGIDEVKVRTTLSCDTR